MATNYSQKPKGQTDNTGMTVLLIALAIVCLSILLYINSNRAAAPRSIGNTPSANAPAGQVAAPPIAGGRATGNLNGDVRSSSNTSNGDGS